MARVRQVKALSPMEEFEKEMSANAVLSKEYKDHLCRLADRAVADAHARGLRDGKAEAYRKVRESWGGRTGKLDNLKLSHPDEEVR